MYDAPTTRALMFFDHDLVGDVRTACERIAAQDNPAATTVRRTRKKIGGFRSCPQHSR